VRRRSRTAAPWTDSRFWVLQLVVLALALVRLALTVTFDLRPGDLVLEVSTVVLFVVPVVIAALDYGLVGGMATVTWVAVVCAPTFVAASSHGNGAALGATIVQIGILAMIALLVGGRVSADAVSRDQAEAAREARLRAELLYQEMFESNVAPILIVDADGFVVGSNGSADRAFAASERQARPPGVERPAGGPRRLVDVIGPEAAGVVLTRLVSGDVAPDTWSGAHDELEGGTDGSERVPPIAFEVDGQPVLFRPTVTPVGAPGVDRTLQVIFEDVTAETRRHDRMEAFAGQVVLGQEEERRHIAQELHDGPLQTLIHLCRQIDALPSGADLPEGTSGTGAGSGAPRRSPERTAALADLRTTVEDTVAELRSIARGLRPSVLDDLGLVASINQVLSEATDRGHFEGSFEVHGEVGRLPSQVELALFRIAQEAITNIERHADATTVTVVLDGDRSGLRLTVADDGSGFDRPAQQRDGDGASLGLPGMGERARLIGGRLRVRSQVGKGTEVEVRVPRDALGA
jgi:signal transduction histidine kinase